ncbi:hypothetical protein HMPREF3213_00596 [Heyndrickxia coagulans]|uniref:Uncharacterized protein n=4 Tax=Heyndrickxia TaxID=2837504 RepID=A0A133L010_HEYCO|nr:hypothetical protein HMPREF3213_00596 [Heyndrickxia coagulans]
MRRKQRSLEMPNTGENQTNEQQYKIPEAVRKSQNHFKTGHAPSTGLETAGENTPNKSTK